MDELHLLAAVSYVSLNPVRAGLVGYAADWAWPSVCRYSLTSRMRLLRGHRAHRREFEEQNATLLGSISQRE
jgi:hypothetical protein